MLLAYAGRAAFSHMFAVLSSFTPCPSLSPSLCPPLVVQGTNHQRAALSDVPSQSAVQEQLSWQMLCKCVSFF